MKKKPIYIFQFWAANPHLETAFELAIKNIKKGENVEFFWGGDCVSFNEYNGSASIARTFKDQKPYSRLKKISQSLTGNKINFHEKWVGQIDGRIDFEKVTTIEEFKKLKYKNFEIGMASVSSLSQLIKKTLKGNDFQKFLPYLQSIFKSGIEVYNSVHNILEQNAPKEIYVFNGRFINYAAVASAGELLGIKVKFHERGATQNKYMVLDYRVHDLAKRKKTISNFWCNTTEQNKKNISKQWFDNSINSGIATDWKSHSQGFDRKSNFQNQFKQYDLVEGQYIVFFQSSDDEYNSISSALDIKTEWNNQLEIVEFLSKLEINKKIVIRLHPYMAEKSSDDLIVWHKFAQKSKNVCLIDANSNLNSYLLASHANKIITAGSTIGAECIYMGKPAISCGTCMWGDATGAYECYSFSELEKLLYQDLDVEPTTILPYGFYRSNQGNDFEIYKPTSLFSGKFAGVDVFQDEKMI